MRVPIVGRSIGKFTDALAFYFWVFFVLFFQLTLGIERHFNADGEAGNNADAVSKAWVHTESDGYPGNRNE